MNTIKNRSELLFLYDIRDANPNGDPLDSNKPRMDEETSINLVTDVRLKRTIRDYLFSMAKQKIFSLEMLLQKRANFRMEKPEQRILEKQKRKSTIMFWKNALMYVCLVQQFLCRTIQ